MRIFTWADIISFLNTGHQNEFFNAGTGISIGCFDGLHKGHRSLLNILVSQCKKKHLLSGVVTFSRPLPSIKHAVDYQGDITTLNQRIDLLEKIGLDFVIVVDFRDDFSTMLGADFLNILVNSCNMEFLAEGIDFKCGYKGATDAQAIKYFAERNRVRTVFVDHVYYSEPDTNEVERVSSSYIRSMILKGFFSTANELLQREYELDFGSKVSLVERKNVLQVIPSQGIYHCKNEDDVDVRVEITEDLIKLDCESQKLKFY